MSDLERRLCAVIRRSDRLMHVLETARALALPDWLVFSGAIYQPVWNDLTGRPLDHGVRDYDLAYFDPSDISWDAEDRVIRRAAAAFAPPLREMVEVRNQARVHVWFEDHFGEAYAPLSCSAEALTRFAAPAFAVAARLEADGSLSIEAPFGLDDLFAMRIAPNPRRRVEAFGRIVRNLRSRWPEVVVLGPPAATECP
jgi:hypothetical protein